MWGAGRDTLRRRVKALRGLGGSSCKVTSLPPRGCLVLCPPPWGWLVFWRNGAVAEAQGRPLLVTGQTFSGSRGYTRAGDRGPRSLPPASAISPSTAHAAPTGPRRWMPPTLHAHGGPGWEVSVHPSCPQVSSSVFLLSGLPVLLPPDPWPLTSTICHRPEVHVHSSFGLLLPLCKADEQAWCAQLCSLRFPTQMSFRPALSGAWTGASLPRLAPTQGGQPVHERGRAFPAVSQAGKLPLLPAAGRGTSPDGGTGASKVRDLGFGLPIEATAEPTWTQF